MKTQTEYKIMSKSGVFLERVWYNPSLSEEDVKRALVHVGYENVEIVKVG